MNCSKNRPKFNGVLVIFSSARNFPLSFIATRVIFRLCKSIPMWIMTSSLVCLCGNYNLGGDVLFVKIKRLKRMSLRFGTLENWSPRRLATRPLANLPYRCKSKLDSVFYKYLEKPLKYRYGYFNFKRYRTSLRVSQEICGFYKTLKKREATNYTYSTWQKCCCFDGCV